MESVPSSAAYKNRKKVQKYLVHPSRQIAQNQHVSVTLLSEEEKWFDPLMSYVAIWVKHKNRSEKMHIKMCIKH